MNFSFLNNLKNWQIFLIFFAIIFLLYGQTALFDFTYFDDNTLILDNLRFLSNPSNLLQTFNQDVFHESGSSAFYYRPLLTIYFMVGAFIGEQNPVIYHFLSVLIHLLVVFLLFIFLQRLEYDRNISFWASLIFAIHPVLSQAVAWIPGSNDSLVTIFILLSFIFFIDYYNSKGLKYAGWHLIFWLFALFSKETGVFAPILFCLYLFLKRKTLFVGDRDGGLGSFVPIVFGWLTMFVFWFFLRAQGLGGEGIRMSLTQSIQSILNNFSATFLYIGKIFFPFNLSGLPIFQDSTFIFGIIATLLFAVIILWNRKELRWANIIFGLLWFIVFLIPSFIRPNQQIVADFLEHRVYLSLIGFIIIFLEIYLSAQKNKFSKIRFLWTALFVLIIVVFCFINFFHSRIFMNKISFWENAVQNSPHAPLAHRNLGAMYWLDGRLDEAEKEYRESLRLNPDEHMAHNNLGLIYASGGDFESAIKEYKIELEINPYYDNALYNMGLAYWNIGKKEDAAEKWKETINTNPDYFDAYKALIVYYQDSNRKDLTNQLLLELQRRGGM